MPSHADAPSHADVSSRRVWVERALRASALVLAAYALWLLIAPRTGGTLRFEGSAVERALPELAASPIAAIHIAFAASPSPETRDALGAIARAGTRVTWSGPAIVPLAMTAARLREPAAPVRLAVYSTGDVELRDALGLLDSVRASAGATLEVNAPTSTVSAVAQRTRTTLTVAAPGHLKPVLVLGHASWESKFVVIALEQAGWTVQTRLSVAPAADVTQGPAGAIDTARYAAVVALDSSLASSGAALPQFVRNGGGLVLLADAGNASSVRQLAPAHAGARIQPASRDFAITDPASALPLLPLDSLRPDAVRIAAQGPHTVVAARREGAGRIVQVGFVETWRWRMQGADESGTDYRDWWSHIVASVVATPESSEDTPDASEGAPLARLVDALGPASAIPTTAVTSNGFPPWLIPLLLLILLLEWTSRRLRGAR